MVDESDLRWILGELASPDPESRYYILLVLLGAPTGDARVRVAIEQLIEDRTTCPAQPPAFCTEVRWYAANALAAEREHAGIVEPISLEDVFPPLDPVVVRDGPHPRDAAGRQREQPHFHAIRLDERHPTAVGRERRRHRSRSTAVVVGGGAQPSLAEAIRSAAEEWRVGYRRSLR